MIVNNAIQANDFPRHLKAGDLVATVLGGDTGFEKSGANGVQRGEIFTVLKQHVATLDLAPGGDHLFNALHLLAVQAATGMHSSRRLQLGQVTSMDAVVGVIEPRPAVARGKEMKQRKPGIWVSPCCADDLGQIITVFLLNK